MRTPHNLYSERERAQIEANARRAHERLSSLGDTLSIETHRELAEFAFVLQQIKRLEEMLAAVLGEDKG